MLLDDWLGVKAPTTTATADSARIIDVVAMPTFIMGCSYNIINASNNNYGDGGQHCNCPWMKKMRVNRW
jgi:hypothetical protein